MSFFVVDGFELLLFDTKDASLTDLQSLNITRSQGGCAVAANRLFLVGSGQCCDTLSWFNATELLEKYEQLRDIGEDGIGTITENQLKINTTGTDIPVTSIDATFVFWCGGYSGKYENGSFLMNAETLEFERRADMNTPRCAHGACCINGYVYVVGGYNGKYLRSVERYDRVADEWENLCPMRFARTCISICTDGERYIYAVGGYSGSDYICEIERYDIETNKWTIVASLADAKLGIASFIHEQKLHALFGSPNRTNQMEVFDISNPDNVVSVKKEQDTRSSDTEYFSACRTDGSGGFLINWKPDTHLRYLRSVREQIKALVHLRACSASPFSHLPFELLVEIIHRL